jgi:uncharacterized protein with HEPN domain
LLRNYDTVSAEVIWETVVSDVPVLMAQITLLLEEAGQSINE